MTVQGPKVVTTLYAKSSSGSYVKYNNTVYAEGSSKTFYKRGSRIDVALYRDGGSVDVYPRGDLCTSELHYAGTTRANLIPATFTATSAVLARSV